ncbi:MAG: serine/threonine protein kinase, partial [Myxococcales bacterium]|nr:serine/threonine protein kinase [Myxococcales bacterium]
MATHAEGSGSAWASPEGGLVDHVAERRLRAMVHERLFGEPQPPVRVGRYRVQGRLGVGSMGTVYAAVDDELDRKVALKLLHSHMVDDPSVGHARLLREARALARLDHPNVVTVYEVGVHGGDVFLAMEHIEGETLGAWLASARRSTAAILDVMIAAGRGLAAAHDAGLVHRDIKPDNIIVDRRGRVRVVDFGLVRALPRPGVDGLTPLTGAEVILGTPAYMSPEQIRGERLTAASDLYSFCMVLYEALFGE